MVSDDRTEGETYASEKVNLYARDPVTSAQLTSRMFPENYDNFSEKNRKYDGRLREERDWLTILSCLHLIEQDIKTFTPLLYLVQSIFFGF